MSIKNFISVFCFIVTLVISGCKSTPIRNVDHAQFVAPSYASLEDIEKAIIRGSLKAGWRTKTLTPGKLLASYSYKRNRYGAVVKILFDRESYQIQYHSSHNLKYKEKQLIKDDSPEFVRDSLDFFSQNNPFKDDDLPPANEKPATIHKIYNQWVTELENRINLELAALSNNSNVVKVTRKLVSSEAKLPGKCDNEPIYNASGKGRVNRSSVNIRKGAGTGCGILTKLSNMDSFALLGKKNNWYFISLNSGDNGWVYAPLVNKVVDKKVSELMPSSSPPPVVKTVSPPTVAPVRNISIAVIRFKTLNKEADDISLGELVSETFTSALVNSRNFKIIEREQLDKLVKEMEMGQTGFIETTDAVEIGKMLHADAIITGSVALLNGQIQLNARIIDIESAYVISADTKTANYTLKNITLIVNEIVDKLAVKLDAH